MRAAAYGGLMGTNIRVGQEDNLMERPGRLFKSNAEQIEKIKRILNEFDIAVMTPSDARNRLGLASSRTDGARVAARRESPGSSLSFGSRLRKPQQWRGKSIDLGGRAHHDLASNWDSKSWPIAPDQGFRG